VTVLGIFLNEQIRTGGHRRYLDLLAGLARRGHTVYLLRQAGSGAEPPEVVPVDAPSSTGTRIAARLPFRRYSRRWRSVVRARRSELGALEPRPEAIIVFDDTLFPAAEAAAAACGGAAVVVAVRSNMLDELDALGAHRGPRALAPLVGAIERRVILRRERRMARYGAHLVFQTDYDRYAFLSRNPVAARRTAVVPNDIAASWFAPAWENANDSTRCRRLIFVGALNRRKGIPDLLEAFRRLHERYPDTQLELVGDGYLADTVRLFRRTHGLEQSLVFDGPRAEVFPRIAAADLLVLPSLVDSFPNVLLEALYVGTPAVGSAVGGIREILAEEELLAPPGSPEALSARLEELCSDDATYRRAREICAARKEAFRFDWAERFEGVLSAAVDRRADGAASHPRPTSAASSAPSAPAAPAGRPRTLLLLTASYGGGAERLVLDQLKYSAEPAQYAVATLRQGNIEDDFRAAASRLDSLYFSLRAPRGRPLGAAVHLARYVARAGVEVIHAHLPEAMIVAAAVKVMCPQVRVIVTKHNAEPYMKKPLWRGINYVCGMLAARIVCVSEGVREFEEIYAYPRKLEVIYNGIDTRRFTPRPSGVREELGIDPERRVIGVVGRLAEQKGHPHLLEALHTILDRGLQATLLIVGHGEEEARIRGRIGELALEDHVMMLSYRDDIEALYNALDLFCLPSLWEGFGLVLAEAMACGVPVVATRITGVTEVVAEDEGFLVEPGDSQALAGAIERALTDEDERTARARRGYEKAQRFDIRRSVAELETLYETVAAPGSPSAAGPKL